MTLDQAIENLRKISRDVALSDAEIEITLKPSIGDQLFNKKWKGRYGDSSGISIVFEADENEFDLTTDSPS